MSDRRQSLPFNLPPRGLSRAEAAAYIGVAPGTFQLMVHDGRMPQPKAVGTRLIWDRLALDRAFDSLPDRRGRVTEQDDAYARCAV